MNSVEHMALKRISLGIALLLGLFPAPLGVANSPFSEAIDWVRSLVGGLLEDEWRERSFIGWSDDGTLTEIVFDETSVVLIHLDMLEDGSVVRGTAASRPFRIVDEETIFVSSDASGQGTLMRFDATMKRVLWAGSAYFAKGTYGTSALTGVWLRSYETSEMFRQQDGREGIERIHHELTFDGDKLISTKYLISPEERYIVKDTVEHHFRIAEGLLLQSCPQGNEPPACKSNVAYRTWGLISVAPGREALSLARPFGVDSVWYPNGFDLQTHEGLKLISSSEFQTRIAKVKEAEEARKEKAKRKEEARRLAEEKRRLETKTKRNEVAKQAVKRWKAKMLEMIRDTDSPPTIDESVHSSVAESFQDLVVAYPAVESLEGVAIEEPLSMLLANEYRPISKVAPTYPRRAQARGIEGWVLIEFTVSAGGSVEQIVVLDSQPKGCPDFWSRCSPEEGVFDAAAIDAASQFKYEPTRLIDATPVATSGVRNRIDFSFDN